MTPTVDLKAEAVEKVARAIAKGAGQDPDHEETDGRPAWMFWREEAIQAIAAHTEFLSEKGLGIVPREPTKEMLRIFAGALEENYLGDGVYDLAETHLIRAYKALISAV